MLGSPSPSQPKTSLQHLVRGLMLCFALHTLLSISSWGTSTGKHMYVRVCCHVMPPCFCLCPALRMELPGKRPDQPPRVPPDLGGTCSAEFHDYPISAKTIVSDPEISMSFTRGSMGVLLQAPAHQSYWKRTLILSP